ncbi:tetratricopeptide repeat protein [Duganella sp. PWIR1]
MNYAIDIDRAVEDEDQATALRLAEQWVTDAPEDAAAWGKLAHVHEMDGNLPQANIAATEALRISPDYQPYLFEKGYIEYRLANYAEAAQAFAACGEQAELTNDSFYLDAARIAQARCLALGGQTRLAADVIAAAAPGAATWLDGRFSKEDVLKLIHR